MSHKVHFLTPKPVMLLSKDKETLLGFLSWLSEDLGGEKKELYSKEGDLRVGTKLSKLVSVELLHFMLGGWLQGLQTVTKQENQSSQKEQRPFHPTF